MRKKRLITVVFVILAMILISFGIRAYRIFKLIPEMIRLNGKLQSEGYYMGECEFKMLGIGYWLDKGQYRTALVKLNQFHKQLKTKSGLIKVPNFSDKKEEYQFYLGLQNPKTGAFMDDTYPLFTYIGPTLNMAES